MIGVVGLGLVGLTTALGFAHQGQRVCGFDINAARQAALREGRISFQEPQLERYLIKHYGADFVIAKSLKELVGQCRIIFFCVETPNNAQGKADLKFLKKAIQDSLAHIPRRSGKIIVVKSTVPPGTAVRHIIPWIKQMKRSVNTDVGLISNPEFLREGTAWDDCVHPDRIIIGAADSRCAKAVAALYRSFKVPVHVVSLTSAEFIKVLSNCLLANLISFANEMAVLADQLGDIDVKQAFSILHEDRRWTGSPAAMSGYVYPGCGYGGYCLPKDTQAVHYLGRMNQQPMTLLKASIDVNERTKAHWVAKIMAAAKKNQTIGILGLSFKPGSGDVRGTAAADIIRQLLARGYRRIVAYDPWSNERFAKEYALPIQYAASLNEIAKQADVLLLVTAWPEFQREKKIFQHKTVIDGRYFLDEGR